MAYDDFTVVFKMTADRFYKLEKLAAERNLDVDELVQEAVNRFMARTDRFYMGEPEEMQYIVFQGVPKEFQDLKEAERFATEKAEETKSQSTIMSVPKVATEIALAAVYHGVVIHALSKVQDGFEED